MSTQIKSLQEELTSLKEKDIKSIIEQFKADTDKQISEIAGELNLIKSIQTNELKDFVRNTVAGAVRNAISVA